MKKISTISLVAIIIIVIFLPLDDVRAYEGGLLDGKTLIHSNSLNSGSLTSQVTDRNINTYVKIFRHKRNNSFSRRYLWYQFDTPTFIDSYRIYFSGYQPAIRFYDEDENLIKSVAASNNIKSVVNVEDVKKVAVYYDGTSAVTVKEFDVFGPPLIEELKNLLIKSNYNNVSLSWTAPSTNSNFIGTKIYRDGVQLATVDKNVNTFEDYDVLPNTTYNYKVTAIYSNGTETEGLTEKVITPLKPVIEVKDLEVETSHNRVSLFWVLPEYEGFNHVNIYRDVVEKNFLKNVMSGSIAYAAETPIFETNGTYFNDLTVEPETTYEYTLKTESILGIESEGITIQTTTPPDSLPEMGGEEIEKDENGDFKLTWISPTTGQVKILVDGNEYAIVDASLQEYVIPADDMVYDLFGKPKVQLIAIDEDGKEGNPSKPPVNNGGSGGSVGVNLPDIFNVNAFLKTVMSLIAWVGPFILLALAIRLAPRIVKLIKDVIARYREGRLRL